MKEHLKKVLPMKSIVYVSEEAEVFSTKNLQELSAFAQERNLEYGITGYLHYQRGMFIQYIEGPQKEIDHLFQSIGRDKRHQILFQLTRPLEDDKRLFPNWSMRFLTEQEISQINLEHLLAETLMRSKKSSGSNIFSQKVWSLVASIAKLQEKLKSIKSNFNLN